MKELVTLAESLTCVSDDSLPARQELPQNLQPTYHHFLSLCDGGYTRDHLFHFFGRKGPREHNLIEWNRPELWKKYFGLDDTAFFFAEDILGTQFCFDLRGNRKVVKMLIPASGKLTLCANTFQEFVTDEIMDVEINAEARQLAERFFTQKREQFQPFVHIACKIPPLLGGNDRDLANLELARASTNLRILGQITAQVKDLPSGTRITEVKVDREKEEIVLVPETHSWLRKLF